MTRLSKILLLGSIILLFPIFVLLAHSFQPLYYVLWVLGVGGYVYRNQESLFLRFQSWSLPPFTKFFFLGIAAILTEECFAALSMHLMRYVTTGNITYFQDVLQFWTLNLLALPGIIIGWYVLLRRYAYTRKEIFVLAGLFGIYSEKIIRDIILFPLAGILLIVPTIFTYGLIVSIPALSLNPMEGKQSNRFLRYVLALIIPFIFCMPFIAIAIYIKFHHPSLFPPTGFFM